MWSWMGTISAFASVVIKEQDCTSLPSSGFSRASYKPTLTKSFVPFLVRWFVLTKGD